MEYVALFQLNMAIFFVVIWKHVWRIIIYKVKEKKRGLDYIYFFQAKGGIRNSVTSRGLGKVYKRKVS